MSRPLRIGFTSLTTYQLNIQSIEQTCSADILGNDVSVPVIGVAGYPILSGWSAWIRQIPSEYLFGLGNGQPNMPSNIMLMIQSD